MSNKANVKKAKLKRVLSAIVVLLCVAVVAYAWGAGYFSGGEAGGDAPGQYVAPGNAGGDESGEGSAGGEGDELGEGEGQGGADLPGGTYSPGGTSSGGATSGGSTPDGQVSTPTPDFADYSIGGTLTGEQAIDGDVCVWEDAWYDTAPEVALYIYTFGGLPDNYMTKADARKKGWESGALSRVVKGMSIGGDRFGNNEGLLPKAKGRTYTECDIETTGEKTRGAKRIVFSSDGMVFYTDDHYETFTQLY